MSSREKLSPKGRSGPQSDFGKGTNAALDKVAIAPPLSPKSEVARVKAKRDALYAKKAQQQRDRELAASNEDRDKTIAMSSESLPNTQSFRAGPDTIDRVPKAESPSFACDRDEVKRRLPITQRIGLSGPSRVSEDVRAHVLNDIAKRVRPRSLSQDLPTKKLKIDKADTGELSATKITSELTVDRGQKFVYFAELDTFRRRAPCSVQLEGKTTIGSTGSRSDGWMVFVQLDGGCHGNPSIRLTFEANIRKGTKERLSIDKSNVNCFTVWWLPGSKKIFHLAVSYEIGEVTLVLKSKGTSRTGGKPDLAVWDQYGDVADTVRHLLSSKSCNLTFKIRSWPGYHETVTSLSKAFQTGFSPVYTYPRRKGDKIEKLDLRELSVISAIREAWERQYGQPWKHEGGQDPATDPDALFDLPKRLGQLLDHGIKVTMEQRRQAREVVEGGGSGGVLGGLPLASGITDRSEDGESLEYETASEGWDRCS